MIRYGIQIAKKFKRADSPDPKNFQFISDLATYMVAKTFTVVVNANPYVVIHNLNYVPKVLVFEILSDHSRKLPYDDGTANGIRDFSVTKNEIKIRGRTSGTFKIYVFAQGIL